MDTNGSLPFRPKLIAIDVDHTLIHDDHTLSRATKGAVHAAREGGIDIVLASSRSPLALRSFLLELELIEPAKFVGCQGAFVGSLRADGSVATHSVMPIELATALRAAETARGFGLATNWYSGDRWIVDRISPAVEQESSIVGISPEVLSARESRPAPEKLLFIAPDRGTALALKDELPGSLSVEFSNERYLEVTAAGVDKATGVRYIAADASIDPADIVAIGDGPNDLGLFSYVGRSFAPANAHPDVAAAADFMTPSNNDDGVAAALKWLTALPAR